VLFQGEADPLGILKLIPIDIKENLISLTVSAPRELCRDDPFPSVEEFIIKIYIILVIYISHSCKFILAAQFQSIILKVFASNRRKVHYTGNSRALAPICTMAPINICTRD
jgi:hypothetical protein